MVGLVTAAVTSVVRKAVEAGKTLFAAVHLHSARPDRVPGERSLEVARDGHVMTSLPANRHLFLRQVCAYVCDLFLVQGLVSRL